MKYIIQKWDSDADGYLFAIQRLQEMLFHYSDDIVKAPIHNTRTLLEEYVDTEKSVVQGSVKQYQLDVIVKEIKESLSKDFIVQEMFNADAIEEMIGLLEQDQKTAVHYIYHKLPPNKYYSVCCQYLQENISKANCKNEIEKGLRSWLAHVIWYGYSPEYVYRFLWNTFENDVLNTKGAMNTFWGRFDFKKNTYKVYFVFYKKLKPYQTLLQKRLQILFEDDGCFGKIKKKQESFIGYMEVKAYDNYGAMRQAYNALEIFLRFLGFFSNDSNRIMGKNGLAIQQDTDEGFILPIKSFGYKNLKPEPGKNFSVEIDSVVLGCQNKRNETYLQLSKIVDLHNAALNQLDLNDAFLNLWSALEVASVSNDSTSKIQSVVDCVVPILQNTYFECALKNLCNDLKNNIGNSVFEALLDKIKEFDEIAHKIAGFIFLEKYEKLREEYFTNELKYYPNIRYKIYNLYVYREDKRDLWKISEKYGRRIEWHLYRLYRLRNAIVHAGESHKRIQMLGEHLHIYVDRMGLELMLKLAGDECLGTIQDVLTDTQLLLVRKKKYFKDTGIMDEKTINLLLENNFIAE